MTDWNTMNAGEADQIAETATRPGRSKRGDPEPRKRSKAKQSKPREPGKSVKQRTAELERELARTLTFPAVPAIMFLPDDESKAFVATHFVQAGPRAAHELAELSEYSTELREILEGLGRRSVPITLAFIAAGYLAPPALWIAGLRPQAQAIAAATQADPEQLQRTAEWMLAQRRRASTGAFGEQADAETMSDALRYAPQDGTVSDTAGAEHTGAEGSAPSAEPPPPA